MHLYSVVCVIQYFTAKMFVKVVIHRITGRWLCLQMAFLALVALEHVETCHVVFESENAFLGNSFPLCWQPLTRRLAPGLPRMWKEFCVDTKVGQRRLGSLDISQVLLIYVSLCLSKFLFCLCRHHGAHLFSKDFLCLSNPQHFPVSTVDVVYRLHVVLAPAWSPREMRILDWRVHLVLLPFSPSCYYVLLCICQSFTSPFTVISVSARLPPKTIRAQNG